MKCFLFHPAYKFSVGGVLEGHGKDLKIELIEDNLYKIQPNKKLGINTDGFRDKDFSTQKHGKKRICFLGDSYVMGLNVKSEETIPKVLEQQFKNTDVYNMGVVGFGPDQELNVLQKYVFRYNPDLIIDAICSINDSGDIWKDQLFSVSSRGELRITKMNPVKTLVFLSSSSIVNQINFLKNRDDIIATLDPLLFSDIYDLTWIKYHDTEEARYKFSLMKAILKEMKERADKKNIPFLAIIIPSYNNICDDAFFKENNIAPDKYFANEEIYQFILESEKIPYINLAPYFMSLDKTQRCGLFQVENGHLSPAGNWYTAQIISHYMDNHGLLKNEFRQ
ncbi:MAG: hypothetical protein HQL14_04955 [Candidatus Omnitrophica bacterium]|nr:hypothetical protein [Candidatus Omnitrophota bacterium]